MYAVDSASEVYDDACKVSARSAGRHANMPVAGHRCSAR